MSTGCNGIIEWGSGSNSSSSSGGSSSRSTTVSDVHHEQTHRL
jgi:hypothetical protein